MAFDIKRKHSIVGGSSVAAYYQDGVYYTATGVPVPDHIAAMSSEQGEKALSDHLSTDRKTVAAAVNKPATTHWAPQPAASQLPPPPPPGYNGPEGDEPGVDPAAEKPTAPSGKDDPEQRKAFRDELEPMKYASLKKLAMDAGMPEDQVPTGEGAKDKLIDWLLDNTEY